MDSSMAPPPHPEPNYINPPTRAPMVLATNITFTALSLIILLLRVYSRQTIHGQLNYEDFMCVIAWLLSAFLAFCLCWTTRAGVGRHYWDIPPEWLSRPNSFPAVYIMTWVYTIVLTVIKMSILIFYLRLSPKRSFKWACYIVSAYVILTGLAETFLLAFACNPIAAIWDHSLVPMAKCLDQLALYKAVAVLNFAGDVFILFLPMPMLIKLQLPLRKKLQVMVVFLLGGLVTVVSAIRIYLVVEAEKNFLDYNWLGALPATWSGVEVNVALICACLPAVKPLLSKTFPTVFGTTKNGGTGKNSRNPKPSYAPGFSPYALKDMSKSGGGSGGKNMHSNAGDSQFVTSVMGRTGPSESEEHIVGAVDEKEGGITVTKTVDYRVDHDLVDHDDKSSVTDDSLRKEKR